MRPPQAALLGVVQGVAEVVPVSSSAQLALLPWLLRWDPPADRTTFAAALHAGSCAGIVWVLRPELRGLDRRTLALVAATSAPAAVAGLLAHEQVEARLGRPPQLAALLAASGALMWWVDARRPHGPGTRAEAARRDRQDDRVEHAARVVREAPADQATGGGARAAPRPVSSRAAALAGVAQVAALVPGVSRSGATLIALRSAGVDRATAERFSLLMSLPVTAGAAAFTLVRADRTALRSAASALVIGATTAAVAGAVAARYRREHPGRPPTAAALYRLGLAAVVARRLIREGAA